MGVTWQDLWESISSVTNFNNKTDHVRARGYRMLYRSFSFVSKEMWEHIGSAQNILDG
jgi:hypothetical protein